MNGKRTSLGLWTLALGLLIAGAAAAQKVTYDFDRSVDFSRYRTYRWVEIEGVERPDQLTDKNIKAAIDTTLAGKGLTRTEGDTADLYVAYQVSVSEERQLNAYNYGGYGWGGWWGGGGSTSVSTSTIHVGTLVVDMYDPALQQLVWRGQATKSLNPKKDPEKNRKRLQKAVDKLLRSYPPASGAG